MDSLSQLALGAAVGGSVMGRKVGVKAWLWGGVIGTLPDLDVFVSYGDPVADFTYHRGYSHAFFIHALISPIIAWLLVRFHPQTKQYYWGWLWLVFLCLTTHALLDCFTVYGTQVLLPFSEYPVGWSTIFIIDPIYTLPLLIGVIMALLLRNDRAIRWNTVGLVLSSIYLAITVINKVHVNDVSQQALANQSISQARILTTPSPFNNLLWRIIARDDSHYYEGYYSILDDDDEIDFKSFPIDEKLLDPIANEWSVQRLRWFSKGFYTVDETENDLIRMSDLRMGLLQRFVFNYAVGQRNSEAIVPISPQYLQPGRPDRELLQWVWQRIWRRVPAPL